VLFLEWSAKFLKTLFSGLRIAFLMAAVDVSCPN
jgi:hypothetical protein